MRGARGLTLIELVVAMALFALVAVMGLQTLDGTIRTRDALSLRDDRDRALAVTLALLRADLGRMAPLLFYPPNGPPLSALHQDRARIGFSVAVAPERGETPFQRAEWHLDRASGTVFRSFWPTTTPARASQRSRERAFLTGVSDWRLRSYWTGLGWVEGSGASLFAANEPPESPDEDAAFAVVANQYSDQLPAAVELTLTLDGLGDIRIVEALQ